MVRHVLRNGQITLPKEAMTFFHLKPQDLVDVRFDRMEIHLKPLTTEEFSQADYDKLARKLDALKRRAKGKTYATTEEARRHLDRLMKA